MSFISAIKKGNLIISIILGTVGYLLVTQKEACIELALSIFAIGLVIAGIFNIIRYALLNVDARIKRNDFILGLVFVAAGVIVYFLRHELIGTITILLGVIMIICGLYTIQDLLDARKVGVRNLTSYFIIIIIDIAFGVITILNPFETLDLLYTVMGIGLLIIAIESLVFNLFLSFCMSRMQKRLKQEEEKIAKENKFNNKEPEIIEAKFTPIDADDDPEVEKPLE